MIKSDKHGAVVVGLALLLLLTGIPGGFGRPIGLILLIVGVVGWVLYARRTPRGGQSED